MATKFWRKENLLHRESVGVVVLNYVNYQRTVDCVKTLLKQTVEMDIVIVDNGSNNGSAAIFKETFKNENKVTLLGLKNNIGYAKGNNVGIELLRAKGIDHIAICNSDILFPSSFCLEQMLSAYEKQVGLICPLIVNRDGTIDQRVECKKQYIYLRLIKKIMRSHIYRLLPLKKPLSQDYVEHNLNLNGLQEDRYVVTGSLYLLTPDFFICYDKLFPETFLYYEEYATILLLHKANLKSKIVDTDPVVHIGEASTPNSAGSGSLEKQKLIAESGRKILKLFLLSPRKIKAKYRNWRS